LTIEGRPLPPPGKEIGATFRVSRPGYFQVMGSQLRGGRDFNQYDTAEAPGVVIINETLANRHWPNEDPVGKRVTLDDPRATSNLPRWLTIVGVVKDLKQGSWTDAPSNEFYLPFAQSPGFYASRAG
jgi:putative ABC transport system permease protein